MTSSSSTPDRRARRRPALWFAHLLLHPLLRLAALRERSTAAAPPQSERVPKKPGMVSDAGEDWAFCVRSLKAVSRTFSLPIAMLPRDLEVAVTCGYLLCRIADTVEDHPLLAIETRDTLFALFLSVLEQGANPGEFARRFGTIPGDDAELELGRNLPRVMRVWNGLDESAREACRRWIPELVRGMQIYTHRKPDHDRLLVLHTMDDLERYCYFVAGTVGQMLTDLFARSLHGDLSPERTRTLRDHAAHFGAGLQLVNVLKDVVEDRERGVCFIPESVCAAHGLAARELIGPAKGPLAHAAVAEVFDLARRHLDDALEYALAIPAQHTGIRMFCIVPLWMAVRTLVCARGNDDLFTAGEAVKIGRGEVARLIAGCTRDVADDVRLRAAYDELWREPPTDESSVHDTERAQQRIAGGPNEKFLRVGPGDACGRGAGHP